ncbi:MAG: hypothetical protein RL038_152 [Actinomycetota bacterium]
MDLSFVQKDRAAGSLLAMACGDALGAGYEFRLRRPFTMPVEMVGGNFGFSPGEWTDDTSMAIVIAEVAARGADLRTEESLDAICEGWRVWRQTAKDVGIQTQSVINRGGSPGTAAGYREAAVYLHRETGRTAGNGSLMRTAPVALAYLHDRQAMAEAATLISNLTHFDPVAAEACVLWCEAIRLSVLSGEIVSPTAGLDLLKPESQSFWIEIIAAAEAKQPHTFPNNGWVVSAFQAAWSAIVHADVPEDHPALGMHQAQHLQIALDRAVRVDNDTDTVAAIAGSLLGAIWGASAIPSEWLTKIHGYPDYSAKDLTRLAILIVQKGEPQPGGWPASETTNYHQSAAPAVELLPNLYVGGQTALATADDFDAVVSLSRVGLTEGGKAPTNHLRVSVLDSHAADMNPNLAFQFQDVADFIDSRIQQNQKVLLHCVHAHTRTPSFAVGYLMRTKSMTYVEAVAKVREVLPLADLHAPFDSVLKSLEGIHPRAEEIGQLWWDETAAQLWLETTQGWFQRSGSAWQSVAQPEVSLAPAAPHQIAEFDEVEVTKS